MRLVLLAVTLFAIQRVDPILPPMPDDALIKENDRVAVRLQSNEVTVRGKAGFVDPVKVRLGSPGHTKGVISFEMQRADGVWEEVVLLTARQDERERADPYNRTGELEIAIRHDDPGPDDPQFKKIALFRWDGITLFVPLAGIGALSVPGRLYSGDGTVCLNVQSDLRGGLVCYDTNRGSTDESTWRPIWALRNGQLENFP